MEGFTHYMAKAKDGKRRVGRPSRKDLGLEAKKAITTEVEGSVVDAIVAEHGSIAAGLRYLATRIRKKAS